MANADFNGEITRCRIAGLKLAGLCLQALLFVHLAFIAGGMFIFIKILA